MKKTKLWMMAAILALCALRPAAMLAQSGDLQDGVEIIHECDTTWHFGYKGINLYSRAMHRIDIAYPSVDAHGHASIDCLIAARQVLDERGISQGKYLLNAGASSGGYDCLAAQRGARQDPLCQPCWGHGCEACQHNP